MDEMENNSTGEHVTAENATIKPVEMPVADRIGIEPVAPLQSGQIKPLKLGLRVGDNAPSPAPGGGANPSFFDMIYDKINNVIGGNNPNQFLCITIPGQALSQEDFAFDYKNNAPKGPTIEANESRLANKLFDPCHVTGADNGMTLPYQYRSALDTLTPKLNAKIATAKNQLRELLLTAYPYDFGDGSSKTYTLQEVFYRLYDDYVAAEEVWAEKQNQAKGKFRKEYPGTDSASNAKYNDAYLEWYETIAQSEITVLNEKRSKVLSVFSPNDMDILAGILDSGSGAELEQARQILQNTQKLTPDGGYVYPVKFNPIGWFELLQTSFTPVDLLKTPDALAMQLQSLSSRRITISARMNEIAALIPNDATVTSLQTQVTNAQTDLTTAQGNLLQVYGAGAKTIISAAFDVASLFPGGAVPKSILTKLAGGLTLPSGKNIDTLVSELTEKLVDGEKAQSALVNAAQNLSTAMMSAITQNGLSNLKDLLSPMKEQLDQIDAQILNVQTQIQLAAAINQKPNDTGKVVDQDTSVAAVAPPEVPAGYTQILIEASSATMDTQTDKQASASASTFGVNFWFGGYSSSKSEASSNFANSTGSESSNIQVGMNIAKVEIEREWFNPGVFALTRDMFNVSTSHVSPKDDFVTMSDDRLKAMNGGYILPCYPTAIVIARDISIKITTNESLTSSFADSVENHASQGGGFLFFSGSSSSSSSSSKSGAHTHSYDNSVTIKFDTPQIIGYYIEAIPSDKSTLLDDVSGDASAAGFVTISKFVEDYKAMLLKMNQKA
jgi:hypothetical protein